MAANDPTPELDERFSSPGATALPWTSVVELIQQAEIFWLSTVRSDGRPHVTPLPAMWLDGALHFCTGPTEQKHKNIEANPNVVLTTGTDRFLSGTDIVVEGQAERVLDRATLEALATMWNDKLNWPFEATGDGFHEAVPDVAGTEFDGTGVAHVFAVRPTKVLVFGKGEPFSQVRYRSEMTPRSSPCTMEVLDA